MHRHFLWLFAALSLAIRAGAQDEASRPVRFARHPSLSPDGSRLAFSYLGDVWTVSSRGGTASRLTIHEAHDQLPAWSPDGKWVAFSSRREGNYDVWIVPSGGGRPRQLTFHSADDLVSGWSPDGRQVLFTSNRESTRYPAIYTVDVDGGAARLVAQGDATLANAAFTPDGKWIACTRAGAWTRKGYRGSANANLMRFPLSGGAGQWLTRDPENERWALFNRDGRSFYYVSDRDGTANLWRRTMDSTRPVQVTRHTDGNLFYPTLSADGSRLVYEHDFGLWSVSPSGGTPEELRIYAPTDDRVNSLRRETFTSGAQEAKLSPDGKQLAFVVHGEVWVQPAGGGEAVRLSETPQREQDIAWSADSRLLAFSSDREGSANLYVVDVKTKETRQLTRSRDTAEHSPQFSPDGKTLAYLRGANGAELCVMPAEGGESRTLVRDPNMADLAWSPDSRWLAYTRGKSHSAGTLADIFIINTADAKPVNVTRYPVINSDPVWSGDRRRLYFRSNRSGNTNLWAIDLQEERGGTEEGEKEGGTASSEMKIDLEDIHRRARQITRIESEVGDYAAGPDGKTLVFAMSQLGRTDLWRIASTGGAPARLTQTGEAAAGLRFASDGSRVIYLSGGQIKSMPLSAQSPSTLGFSVRMEIDTRAELTQMFDEAWRKMRDSFYDEKMHGADWNRVRETYRPVLQDVTYKEDFYSLFNLALGELNASHTGIAGSAGSGQATASLGIVLDTAYSGPGVRVGSVLPKGPASRERSRLNPGDILLKVDGQTVRAAEQFYTLLADKAGKQVELLANTTAEEQGARTVKLRAITQAEHSRLRYDHWVRQREQATEKLSAGRLGYLHLNAMNDENLEKFKRAVFGDMQEKDGLVLDVRFNGGGAIADEILAILQDRVFSYRTIRGDPNRLTAPLQVWTKPLIVLINEASFSNAEAFPWGVKSLRLAKIVGVPTYGAVIGTGGTNLIDGSTLRIPAVGAFTLDGINMENHGCPPDIYVENSPEDEAQGRDRQLERAVEELVKDLKRD